MNDCTVRFHHIMGQDSICDLDDLGNGLPGISETWGQFLSEAASVCLHCQGHSTGVQLEVKGTSPSTFSVCWKDQVTSQLINAWADKDEMAEYGACGVAILLILQLTDFTVVRRACKGTGIDYWLGSAQSDAPFEDAARLEVSGILKGDEQSVKARVAKKKKQTEKSADSNLPAYVAVVEFSKPQSCVVKKEQ